ncbi:MAG: ABC transporter ATP-binding protein [Propionibacteriaceae bacterium]|jgi:branched-chain amino acid transport system ATP-binding protein|nr:ABC transporter ATP-binding protein [Propionibacteriaceae bacterium]
MTTRNEQILPLEGTETLAASDILAVENLSISFGGLKALDDLSFAIRDREIFGLIGPNGAGKTTVFNCITQFYKPDQGTVLFGVESERLHRHRAHKVSVGSTDEPQDTEVVNLVGRKVHSIIKLGLVRTFQNVEVIPELSLIDNVLLGGHVDFRATILEQMFRLPRARREEKQYRAQALEVLEFLKIDHLKDELASGQPYGVLKKLEMARTLMANPRLIILDEPAAGLNDSETEDLAQTIREIRDRYHCAILLVEHDMRLVMGVCERICAISFGRFLALGTPEEIQENPDVQEAYLGEQESDQEGAQK